jgi:hypothetical protein
LIAFEEHIKTKIRNINLSASQGLGQEDFFFSETGRVEMQNVMDNKT